MLTIAIANQKGGVGKSTTTYHLARAAVVEGLRVLTVDLDPQGNLTSSLTKNAIPEDVESVADILSARSNATISDILTPGLWDGLDVAPTTGETLAIVRDELVVAGAGRENRLAAQLAKIDDHYDICLIDCAPSLDQLTINGLTAADAALIITHCKLWSANGLARLLQSIQDVRRYYNQHLAIAGIVVNQYEANTIGAQHWIGEIHQAALHHRLPVFDPPIPKRVAIADSVEASQPLDQWPNPGSPALAEIYRSYLQAILNHTQHPPTQGDQA